MKFPLCFKFVVLTCVPLVGVTEFNDPPPAPPPALFSLTASDLRADLSFLASDTLQGRFTPSPGLDVAAEFIAARFRGAGLKSGSGNLYFQTAQMIDREMPILSSGLVIEGATQTVTIPKESLSVLHSIAPAHIDRAPVLSLTAMDPKLLSNVDLTGKAIVVPQPDFRRLPREQARTLYLSSKAFEKVVRESKAALEVRIVRTPVAASSQLIPANESVDSLPRIAISSEAAGKAKLGSGASSLTISVDIPASHDQQVTVKNVIAILPGSDPALKDTCVLVTAHYDHIGTTKTAAQMANPDSAPNPEDHIYNGANDDGSGTVSVIEIARALAKVTPRPKRSIVFMTFFGEERGELGSAYYVQHPVFAIAKTVADVNLEQVGRTDELDKGQKISRLRSLSLTGFDYSDVTGYLVRAGRRLGINVYKDPEASDAYFTASDNAAFAEHGIPAHSVTVAFNYSDYHGVGDEWQKIDYENMARVDRAIGLAVLQIANAAKAPRWASHNPKTTTFREAQSAQSSSKAN